LQTMAHAALGELQPFAISEYHNHIAMLHFVHRTG
jgi:hypothetical protein